jgi:hypothetical protein
MCAPLVQPAIRVRVEIMGPGKYESVGESQSFLIMINPIICTRTRIALQLPPALAGAHAEASGGALSTVSAGALVQMP